MSDTEVEKPERPESQQSEEASKKASEEVSESSVASAAGESGNSGGSGNDAFAFQPAPVSAPPANRPPVWMWIGLGVLTLTALAVIFVLPSIVQEYELPLERRAASPTVAQATAEPEAPAVSPFEEAQRAIQRKEAQDILAELLEHQAELDRLQVSSWAETSYQAALEQASIGDEYYRTQDFISASTAYREARDMLAGLLDSTDDVLTSTLAEAEQALIDEDSALAEDKFSLALLFAPDSDAAQTGLARARALDSVLALLDEAEALLEDGQLEQARETFREAADLDPFNTSIPESIAAVTAQIQNNEFNRIMSSGYSLLEQGQPQQAIAAFERAAALGVNEQQARAAIVQTETEVANAEISAARERIAAAEAAERWQDAVSEYDTVLAIDPNLTFAVQGRDYAAKRAQLDQLLVSAIDNPERFSDDEVYQQTVDVYFTGRAIDNAGPRLTGQLNELQTLLENSQVPLNITLVSDNLTEVTVLRTADLGMFETTTLSLKPGNYVAVGRRAGYREVREEFTVGFGQTPEQVIVRCEERVATSR